jgi:hypothetical protein
MQVDVAFPVLVLDFYGFGSNFSFVLFISRAFFSGRLSCSLHTAWAAGLPDVSLHNMPKRGKIYQITKTLPNETKIYQMAITYS